MVSKIRIAEKLSWNVYTGDEKRGTFRRGFFDGAAAGINTRLYKDRTADNNPYAVMIVSRENEVDDWIRWGTIDPEEIARLKKERDERIQKHSDEWAAKWNAMTEKERKAYEKANRGRVGKVRYSKGPRESKSRDGYIQGREAGEKMSINKGMDGSKAKGNIN